MIIIYTTNWCPYCIAAKRFFKENNMQYKEINIEEENISRTDVQKITGQYTVPQIVINNQNIGGYNELIQLHQNNKLKEIIGE